MAFHDFDSLIRAALVERDRATLRRTRCVVTPLPGGRVDVDGHVLIDFASNDYLGLRHHRTVIEAGRAVSVAGAGASPLVSGHTIWHDAAEKNLAEWKGVEAAALLPSGYQANVAAIQTIAAVAQAAGEGGVVRPVRFLIDKLCHASLIDAVRSVDPRPRVFPHNDLAKLERLLAGNDGELDVVCTESIFSMDGDAADLPAFAELKRRYPFVFVVDEAHGTGLYGPDGSGRASLMDTTAAVDVQIVTLGKALGAAGGAVCGSKNLIDALVNFARAYIYSTALAPTTAAMVVAAISVSRSEAWRRERVLSHALCLRRQLAAAGVATMTGDAPIVPIVLGDESAALAASKRLREAGFLVPAIRPPTVARGTSRLRVTLSAAHEQNDIERLSEALSATLKPAVS